MKKTADVLRDWQEEHDEAMQELKNRMVLAPVLTRDDGVSQIELQTDASFEGSLYCSAIS